MRKIALLLGNPLMGVTDWEIFPGFVAAVTQVPFLENDWVTNPVGALFKFTPRFPYGYAVGPD